MSPLPSQKEIERAVLDASNAVILSFQSAPYWFLYESDIQAALLLAIRSQLPGELLISRTAPGLPPYKLHLAYSEYNQRIDIACLDPDAAAQVPARAAFDTYIYSLPVLVGIELKYRKMGDRSDFTDCLGDYVKLKNLPHVRHSLILGFVQEQKDLAEFLLRKPQTWAKYLVPSITEFGPVYVVTPEEIWALNPNAKV